MHRRTFLGVGAAGLALGSLGRLGSARATEEPYAPLGRLDLPAAYEAVVSDDGATAYVATGGGVATVDVSDPTSPTLLAHVDDVLADHQQGPMEAAWDVNVDGDDLLLVGPAQPKSDVVDAAVRFDVSDPATPARREYVETDFPIHNADLADGVAYLTGNDRDRNPLVVVDLETGAELARWSVLDHDPAWADVPQALRPIHDVHVRDDVAYLAYWDAGTHLLDVSDPATPTHLGSVEPHDPADLAGLSTEAVRRENATVPGNHHFAAPDESGDLLVVNAEAWAVERDEDDGDGGDGEDGSDGGGGSDDDDADYYGEPGPVHLYDASDPAAIEHLATIDAPESPDPTGSGVWTTSHNFEVRGDRLYTSWYEGGVKIHDVSDPTNPRELAWWRDPANASFWTAQVAASGGFFVASSTGHRPADPALYTFPDRAGEQADPPPLTDALDARETETPGSHSTQTPTPTPTPSPTPTEDDAPGFGIGTGAAAVGGAAWLWRRFGEREDGE